MRRVLLLVTSLAVSLFAAELLLRATGAVTYRPLPPSVGDEVQGGGRLAHRASEIEGLGYELVPSSNLRWRRWRIATNSAGMRDREPLPDAEGLVRIAAIGDSVTFGWGVEGPEAYPNVLERLLNEDAAAGVEYDVLNFGVSGYSSADEAIVLDQKVRPWKPDLLVLGFVLNDPEIDPLQPLPAAFAPVEWWQHSHLLRLVAQVGWESDVRRFGEGDYHRYLFNDEERWESVVAAFEDIARTAGEMDVRVLLAVFPRIPEPRETWDDYLYEDVHRRIGELGRRNGFVVMDLYPRFRRVSPRRLGVSKGDRHPNNLGHYLAARAIEYRLQHQLRDEIEPATL